MTRWAIEVDLEEEDYRFIMLVCRRKGMDLGDYILDNFDYDDMPDCIVDSIPPGAVCKTCDYNESCPDSKFKFKPEKKP